MIMDFRNKTPKRRANHKTETDYHKYKDDLRKDFNYRCGYCDDHDFFRSTDYQIDHFVPKTQLKTINLTDYSNLVYSCRSCNRHKWNKWPTGIESISNDGQKGFIDPCDSEYDKQFSRNKRGEIVPITPLGVWMWKALNLGNPAHSLVWKLEKIHKKITELQTIIATYPENADDYKKLSSLFDSFMFFLEQQRGGKPIF